MYSLIISGLNRGRRRTYTPDRMTSSFHSELPSSGSEISPLMTQSLDLSLFNSSDSEDSRRKASTQLVPQGKVTDVLKPYFITYIPLAFLRGIGIDRTQAYLTFSLLLFLRCLLNVSDEDSPLHSATEMIPVPDSLLSPEFRPIDLLPSGTPAQTPATPATPATPSCPLAKKGIAQPLATGLPRPGASSRGSRLPVRGN